MKYLIALGLIILFSCRQGETKVEKYSNGKIKSEIEFRGNKKNGAANYYYENGNIAIKMTYKNDTAFGQIIQYFENGGVRCEMDSKNLSGKVYKENQDSYFKGTFNNTDFIRNGLWEEWINEGNVKRAEWTFANDIIDGPYKSFRPDGTIEAVGKYKNGTLNDTLFYMDTKGKCYKKEIWEASADNKSSNLLNTIEIK